MNIFKKQIIDLKNNPKSIILKFKTLSYLIIRLVFLLINILLILLIILSNKFYTIRIGFHKSKWLGSWIIASELFIKEKIYYKTKSLDIFIIDNFVCSKFVYKKMKEKFLTIPFIFYDIFYILNHLSHKNNFLLKFVVRRPIRDFKDLNGNSDLNKQEYDINLLLDSSEVELSLNKEEIKKGEKIISENVKVNFKGIVLLCVRSADYYNLKFPDFDKKFMNYRNYNLSTFIPAINYLTSKGYLVLRMGYNIDKLETNNDLVIDYSHMPWRSEFMDYYLGYACDFCISTGFGADMFARLHRKPMGIIAPAISDIYYLHKNYTFIFNNIKIRGSNSNLTLKEIFENNVHLLENIQKIDQTKFELVKNTPEEIKDLVIEVTKKHENNYIIEDAEAELQNKFWELFFKYKKKITENPKIKDRISYSFLKKKIK